MLTDNINNETNRSGDYNDYLHCSTWYCDQCSNDVRMYQIAFPIRQVKAALGLLLYPSSLSLRFHLIQGEVHQAHYLLTRESNLYKYVNVDSTLVTH